jgi:hypothetical protein
MWVTCPGDTTEITPAHMQLSLHVLSSEGMFASSTVGAPGTHGAGVAGMQGMGVSTPMAAAVAAATTGFAGLRHMPKGRMFSIGLWSMMFAAGWLPENTRFKGSTTRALGAMPIEHMSCAVLTTCIGMIGLLA